MKILHLPSTFLPEHTGGKEVFVLNLIKSIPQADHRVLIHQNVAAPVEYNYGGIIVEVLPLAETSDQRKSYYSMEYDRVPGFAELLDSFQPDVVHFHDQGEHASLTHLKICQARNIRTILTYHSPGQSCLQRALLFTSKVPCDGRIDLTRCTYCRYRIRGVPSWLANIGSHVNLPIDRSGRFVLRNSTQIYANAWREYYDTVDVVQVHAKWVSGVLQLNNVPDQKVRYLEMGGAASLPREQWQTHRAGSPIRFVFIGRCSDIKGIDLLISAVKSLPPDASVEVHFFGPPWDDTEYGRKLILLVKGDPRFQVPRLLKPNEVINELTTMDVCVIPSLWPETGPFTVFDAFAAGLPIVGANLAGIAERVTDNVDGLLFEWGNSEDLAAKLGTLIHAPQRIHLLQQNIRVNRTFKEMATDFLQLYTSLLK